MGRIEFDKQNLARLTDWTPRHRSGNRVSDFLLTLGILLDYIGTGFSELLENNRTL